MTVTGGATYEPDVTTEGVDVTMMGGGVYELELTAGAVAVYAAVLTMEDRAVFVRAGAGV